jgi:hypothetical protein
MLILHQGTLSKVTLSSRGTRRSRAMLHNTTASSLLGKNKVSLKDGMCLSLSLSLSLSQHWKSVLQYSFSSDWQISCQRLLANI